MSIYPPNDAEDLAPPDLERNILQRVDPVRRRLRLGSNEWRVTGGGCRRIFTTDITNYHGFRIRTSLVPGSAGVIRGANGSEFFGVHLQASLRVAFQKLTRISTQIPARAPLRALCVLCG